LRDEIGGALLLEPELRVSMDVAPPIRHIVVKFRNALYDAHCWLSPHSRPNVITRTPVSVSGKEA
jgi:hypothetical protein